MEIKEPVILVVDDDKDIVGAIAKLLEMEGYKVIKAYDGLEALEKLTENSIQLILIDVMMPKLDGLSTCSWRRWRQWSAGRTLLPAPL